MLTISGERDRAVNETRFLVPIFAHETGNINSQNESRNSDGSKKKIRFSCVILHS